MAELTEGATEVVADALEAVSESAEVAAEMVRSLTKVKVSYAALGFVAGAALGGVIAWKVAYGRANTKYSELAEQEIDEMRELFRNREIAVPDQEKPELSELKTIVEEQGYDKVPSASSVVAVDKAIARARAADEAGVKQYLIDNLHDSQREALTNVFAEHGDDGDEDFWDYETEVANRDPEKPYVVHVDEVDEVDYTKSKLVYFAGDDVLVDERENIIADQDVIVGIDNLSKFGHGSQDPNVVYIRNDVLQVTAEIVRTDNDYSQVVHGFIQHSDEQRRRRVRYTDDE